MKNRLDKKILKEEEGLSTPKPINKYTESDIEKTIYKILEKEFKDFTLELYQHQGETEYINLTLSTELKDIKNDLELKRYVIAKLLSEFRQSLFTELSKYLNVVNVKTGSYNFIKNTDSIQFSVIILLSDNNITNWVTGVRKKVESNKNLVKESEENKPIDLIDLHKKNEQDIMDLLWQLDIPLEDMDKFIYNINKSNNNVYENKLPKMNNENNIRNILTNLHKEVLKENKVVKSFNTSKDEFEVKDKLKKQGLKASVEKKGVVRVTYNDKKNSEDQIKKLIESKRLNNVKIILENWYKAVLKEARPKKEEYVDEVEPKKKIDGRTEKSLQAKIKEYYDLSEEIEALEEEHRKFMEKKNLKQEKLYEAIYSTMKSIDQNLYVVDGIVAKLSAEYERITPKYKEILEEVIEMVNEPTRKAIEKLKKQKVSKATIQSNLSVEPVTYPKGKRNESVLKEGLFDWFKGLYYSLKGYLSGLTSARKKLQKVANELNLL